MKNKLLLLLTSCLIVSLVSCLDSDNNVDTNYELTNCQIATFSVGNDSVPGVSSLKFVIDQLSGYIYNEDSMAFGSVLDEKLVTTVTLASAYAYTQAFPEATGDTITLSSSDSIDYSKPVKMVVHSVDGLSTKTYHIWINIHQVNPDTMVWTRESAALLPAAVTGQKVIAWGDQYYMYVKPSSVNEYKLYSASPESAASWKELALTGLPAEELYLSQLTVFNKMLYLPAASGTLYRSTDGQNWLAVNGAPAIKAILGDIKEGAVNKPALAAIVSNEGTLQFAGMSVEGEWTAGDKVPAGFPVSGFGNVCFLSMHFQRLLVLGGKDSNDKLLGSAWATMDGLSWAVQTDDQNPPFEGITGIAVAAYDDKFYAFGGIDASNKAHNEIYRSKDNGVSWAVTDSLVQMPADFKARGYSSVIVDKDNYMLLFGGKETTGTSDLNDLWRGRINRLGFKE